jgi:transcriptional regulator with XRE-family HTH domain
MKSATLDIMPPNLRRSLSKFGADISLARRKRGLTARMMAERIGVALATYRRVEKGDATVSMAVYAMALYVLGFGSAFSDVIDARSDEQGLLFDAERVPKRIRPAKNPKAL